jgi:hypothetical protein
MTKRKTTPHEKKGRPTIYSPELADEICTAIASSEKGLAHLCQYNSHWPARQHIFLWLRQYPDFYDKYHKAKESQAEVLVDAMQTMVDESHKTKNEDGSIKIDVPLLKLKVDTMKWHASKLLPKKFGEAKSQELPNNELDDDVKKRYAEMDEKNRKAS